MTRKTKFCTAAASAGRVAPLAAAALALPGMAQAYVGPGAGLTAIGTMLALAAALVLAVVGFVWYPVKRLLRRRNAASGKGSSVAEQAGE